MHFHEQIINRAFDPDLECQKIWTVFFEEEHFFPKEYIEMSFAAYLDKTCFRSLEASDTYLTVEDMYNDLGEEKDALSNLLNIYEFMGTLCLQSRAAFGRVSDKFQAVIDNLMKIIRNNADKIGYKVETVPSKLGDVLIIVPSDAVLEEALDCIDEKEAAIAALEYKHRKMIGDLEGKRKILASLANYLEPRLKDGSIEKQNKDLAEDLGFLLNNLNIRHNNTVKNEFFAKCQPDLETWYDRTYFLLLWAINVARPKEIHRQIATLKSGR